MTPFVLGIVGDSASGKNTVADAVEQLLGPGRTADVRLDDYHRFTRAERAERGVSAVNPSVHNTPLMAEHLALLRQGRPIRNRSYDHSNGTFGPIRAIEPREVVLVRGLLGFPGEELQALYDLTVFVHPEPELLYRWKLRRDVHSRGYTEAEVLKHIAQHLLDSKQYVLPQAERADVVIRETLPDPDAPDSEVRTTLVLRRAAADVVLHGDLLDRLSGATCEEWEGEVLVNFAPGLSTDAVDAWGAAHFPDRYDPEKVGIYWDEKGKVARRAQLAAVEVMVALLAERVRERSAAEAQG